MQMPWQQNVMAINASWANSGKTISGFAREMGISRRHLTKIKLLAKWINDPRVIVQSRMVDAYVIARQLENHLAQRKLQNNLLRIRRAQEGIGDD